MVAMANGAGRGDGQEMFASLFHAIGAELKASNSAWENVCSRATKLAAQLGATAGAFGHFVEALQAVSDSANNVNGISRDYGAALTRFCIRQRRIEGALRAWGQLLQNQFAGDLEKKCAEWRQSVNDAERRHQRTCKRLKTKQQEQIEAESRHAFVELLHAQRSQFTAFIAALLPIINAQLALLDEGTHVRTVRDSMETALNMTDSQSLVQALLEDLCCSRQPPPSSSSTIKSISGGRRAEDEHKAWDQRVGLGLASSRAKSASQLRLNGPPPSGATTDDGTLRGGGSYFHQLYGGVGTFGGGAVENHRNSMPPPLAMSQSATSSQQFWSPPPPPLHHQNGFSSSSPASSNSSSIEPRLHTIPNQNGQQMPMPMVRHRPPLPQAFISPSAQSSPTKQQRRILVETGAAYSSVQFRPPNAAMMTTTTSLAASSSSCCSVDSSGAVEQFQSNKMPPPPPAHPFPPPQPPPNHNNPNPFPNGFQRPLSLGAVAMMQTVDGSATTSSASAALIAETLQQIDQLGVELDNYCDGLDIDNIVVPAVASQQQRQQGQEPPIYGNQQMGGGRTMMAGPAGMAPPNSFSSSSLLHSFPDPANVRFRPNTLSNNNNSSQNRRPPPPPLPERRNSAISAATPTAPSIADIRSVGASNLARSSHQPATAPNFHGPTPPPPPPLRHPPTPMAVPPPAFIGHHNSLLQNQQQQYGAAQNRHC